MFELSDTRKQLRDAARKLAQKKIAPREKLRRAGKLHRTRSCVAQTP